MPDKKNLKMVKHRSVSTSLAGETGAGEPTSYTSEEYFLGMVVQVVSEIAHSRRSQKETCTTFSRSAWLRHPSAKLQVAPAGTLRRSKCIGGSRGGGGGGNQGTEMLSP